MRLNVEEVDATSFTEAFRLPTFNNDPLSVDNITSNSAMGHETNIDLFSPLDPLESLSLLSSQNEPQNYHFGEWRWLADSESLGGYEASLSLLFS